jgi:hypothetical protein
MLFRLASRARLRELEFGQSIRWASARGSSHACTRVQYVCFLPKQIDSSAYHRHSADEIARVSLEAGVLSKHTAFIAVQRNSSSDRVTVCPLTPRLCSLSVDIYIYICVCVCVCVFVYVCLCFL